MIKCIIGWLLGMGSTSSFCMDVWCEIATFFDLKDIVEYSSATKKFIEKYRPTLLYEWVMRAGNVPYSLVCDERSDGRTGYQICEVGRKTCAVMNPEVSNEMLAVFRKGDIQLRMLGNFKIVEQLWYSHCMGTVSITNGKLVVHYGTCGYENVNGLPQIMPNNAEVRFCAAYPILQQFPVVRYNHKTDRWSTSEIIVIWWNTRLDILQEEQKFRWWYRKLLKAGYFIA